MVIQALCLQDQGYTDDENQGRSPEEPKDSAGSSIPWTLASGG